MLNDNHIKFGAYTPLLYNFEGIEEQVKELYDAGINFAILEHGIETFTPAQKKELFDLFAKYNIDGIYFDGQIMKHVDVLGSDIAMMFDKDKAQNANYYKESCGFGGHMFVDEPGTEHFPELGKTVAEYQNMFPGKCPYINLLPMYANNAQLTGGAWMSKIEYYDTSEATFQKYLDEYVKYVPTNYICTDIYPCQSINGERKTYKDYIKSIEITADACRNAQREFWCCIQTCSWDPCVRIPNEADIRWQVYTLLSYGVTNFLYYIYAYRNDAHIGVCVNKDGTKNEMYNISKRTTSEIKRFEDVYLQYKNLGAYSHNYSDKVPYLRMDNPYKGCTPIQEIVCDDPLLIGVFERKDGSGSAFTLVNMSELSDDKTVNIKLKIAADKVTTYFAGIPCEIKPVNGYYSFTLTTGDGVFVRAE